MPRIILLILLVTLGAVIACGQSLTVEEYAEMCGEIQEDLDDVEYIMGIDIDDAFRYNDYDELQDMEEDLEEYRDLIGQYKSLNPPSGLEELHEVEVEAIDLIEGELLGIVEDALSKSRDLLEASDDEDYDKVDDLQDELEDLEAEYDDIRYGDDFDDILEDLIDARDDLRSSDRRDLEREGCL